MSITNPADFSGDKEPSRLSHVFDDYLEGLVLADTETVIAAAHCLEDSGIPFEGRLEAITHCFVSETMENPAPALGTPIAKEMIQAYAYSGVPFNGAAVRFAADMFGLNETTLRSLLEPTEVLLQDELGFELHEIEEARIRGEQALRALGLDNDI